MFWLTDRYGPRLVGSPEFEEAGEWAVKQLQTWGLTNVRKERFPIGKGWSLDKFHATMTEPRVMTIIGYPKAWTPGTNGTFTADVVRPEIANEADAAKYKGQLRGKIVLTQPRAKSACSTRATASSCATPIRRKWLKEAQTFRAQRWRRRGRCGRCVTGAGGGGWRSWRAWWGGRGAGGGFNVNQFYKDEGARAFDRGSNSDLTAGGGDPRGRHSTSTAGRSSCSPGDRNGDPATILPQVTLAVEHYNRMVRLLDHNVPVKVELNIDANSGRDAARRLQRRRRDSRMDKADEIVLIGAHFDSWQGDGPWTTQPDRQR